jgi:hypothetical protein
MKHLTALLSGVLSITLTVTHQSSATLKDGDVLGPSNWQEAQGLLPDEILEHNKRGEYTNTIMDVSAPGLMEIGMPSEFQDATRANEGRYALSSEGSIVDVKTGKQPTFIMGLPFPQLDAKDPGVGTKIVWNHFYNTWYSGDSQFVTDLVMFGRQGLERTIRTEVKMRMYDGAPEANGRSNPDNLLLQTIAYLTYPADLQGIVSLTWRYRDPDKHDSQWSYVPGLRRARQVSALNRSDGFMGSDLCLDDGPFFDGKPEDFTVRFLERTEQLVLVDPYSMRGEADILPLEGGGWRIVWKDVPRIGADMKGWTGLPWAPVSAVLVRRPAWIVEAVSKDPSYLYGRIVLRIDAETYHGAWVSKYDRAGALLISYQAARGAYYRPKGADSFVSAGGIVVRTAENFLFNRATVILFPPRNPRNPADYHVPFSAEIFGADQLMRLGK